MRKLRLRRNQRKAKISVATRANQSAANHQEQPFSSEMPESIPEATREACLQSAAFDGLFPPPVLIEHFDRLLPGSAERILRMAEKEQLHRQQWESTALEAQKSDLLRGQWMGFGLGVAGLAVTAVCAITGSPFAASFASLTVLAGILVAAFAVSRRGGEEK